MKTEIQVVEPDGTPGVRRVSHYESDEWLGRRGIPEFRPIPELAEDEEIRYPLDGTAPRIFRR